MGHAVERERVQKKCLFSDHVIISRLHAKSNVLGRSFSMDDLIEEHYIRTLIVEGRWTHKEVSNHLKEEYPDKRGLSEISVRSYCKMHNIHKTSRLTDDQLDVVVNNAVCQVMHSFQFFE